MRLVKDGPDLPVRLIQAHEEGRVVFFCGAGISYPAGLPGFAGLVTRLYEELGETVYPSEKAAINTCRYDAAIDLLERRIRNRELVRGKIQNILTPADLTNPETSETHRALLMLARTRSGSLRLVTTNFDPIFQHVLPPDFPYFVAPLLPLPKKTSWHGLVYLHGLLHANGEVNALNNLVVSSGDFGRAYLTERWASRFVTELFRSYTVCFVGYSIDDPVLRYMLDAMSADRISGEGAPEAFAFGAHKNGQEAEEKQGWESKGVTPILYQEFNDHTYLHETLRTWASIYRDGLTGKRAIIARQGAALPSHVQGDGQIDQVLWAITDPSGEPARTFAELDPAPDIAWLEIFKEMRFSSSDLPRFRITPAPTDKEPPGFSLLNRPTSYQLGASMALVGLTNNTRGAANLDAVMNHLASWLVRHLDKPEVLHWVLDAGVSLHPRFRNIVDKHLREHDIPKPLSTIWRLICAGRAQDSYAHVLWFYNWEARLKRFGWSPSLRSELRLLLTPKVHFSKPIDWSAQEEENAADTGTEPREPRIKDYADWDITLVAGDHLAHRLKQVEHLPIWPDALVDSLADITLLLRDVCDLMAELEGASDHSDLSYAYRPSISGHSQNMDFREWTVLVDLCRDAWLATAERRPQRAKLELERWNQIHYPLFRRLSFFAAANSAIVTPAEALSLLLADAAWWLWSVETQREAFRLLVHLAPKLGDAQLRELYGVILAGPPRSMFVEELELNEWNDIFDKAVWHRLEKCKAAGAPLTSEAEGVRASLSGNHPQWKLFPDEHDEFPFWVGTGQDVLGRQRLILPTRRRELVEKLKMRPSADYAYEDDWRETCQKRRSLATTALMQMATEDAWPTEVWREALQVFSDEKFAKHSWQRLGSCLEKMPDDAIRALLHSLGWFLHATAKVASPNSAPKWFGLVGKLLANVTTADVPAGDDPVFEALNHPVGQVSEALIRWWYNTEPKAGTGISGSFRVMVTRLTDSSKPLFRHGRVILSAHLVSLYQVDRAWTVENLLPLFDWGGNIAETKAVWEGYLRSPRLYPALLDDLKTAFLAAACHYNDLGSHDGQYASLLTVGALELREHFTAAELRTAYDALPVKGLAEAAKMVARTLADAGAGREAYWNNRVKPLIIDVWPKSADRRTEKVASALASVCVRAGNHFPEALKVIQPLLTRTSDYYLPVKELSDAGLVKRFPADALVFLNAIVETGERWPLDELKQCVDEIATAEPSLKTESSYVRLAEYLQTIGH